MSIQEVLVSVTVIVIIIAIVGATYITYTNVIRIQLAYNDLTINLNTAQDHLVESIRNANQIVPSYTINGTEYTTDFDTIVIRIPSIDGSNTIINNVYDYQVFFRDPGDATLLRTDLVAGAGSTRTSGVSTIATDLSGLVFNYNSTTPTDVTKVEMIIDTQRTVSAQTLERVGQTTINLRNH